MMTARGFWMALSAAVGLFAGLACGLPQLSLLSLSVLVWLAVEWLQFCWRVRSELPRLQFERTVNGRSDPTGRLWAGRTATVVLRITLKPGILSAGSPASISPMLMIRDVIPENMEVITVATNSRNVNDDDWRAGVRQPPDRVAERSEPDVSAFRLMNREASRDRGLVVTGHQLALRSRQASVTLNYLVRVRSAGDVVLPGVRLRLQDAQGFFLAERFIDVPQSFRVLPAFAVAGDIQPLVKRMNSLPQHGIHRLQRSGLGSELLELREYVPGDPPKAIAWKVSARRDKLMTRQYESEVPVRVQLFVDGSLGTRLGGFGCRLLDQMTYVAASVARAAISVGDPVGAMLFDERGVRRLPALTGERGFHRLLDELADFSINPTVPPRPLTPAMIKAAMSLAGERHPELLDRRVNQIPFSIFPLFPGSRRRFREQFLLAGVLSEVFQLSAADQVRLVHDPASLAKYIQRFLTQVGIAWMEPVVSFDQQHTDGATRMKLFSDAIVKAVSHARDNEVFVVLADLLEEAGGVSDLLPAVKMALGRHHRVAFVCPTPTFRRPPRTPITWKSNSVEDLMTAAEQIRTRELATDLQRELRRLGAKVTCSGEPEAIHLVLSEMDLARTGRLVAGGVPR